MPENIKIGAFVFGAILVLIAILGGNFKLFGAEVAATISNRFLRFVAFALGAIFLVIATYPSNSGESPIIKGTSSPQPTRSSQPSPSPSKPPPSITLTPSPSSSSVQKLVQALEAVNIDFSNEKLRNELGNRYSRYPQFATGCLNLLDSQRLKNKTYFDVIISDYQDLGGAITFNSPDGNLDQKILKDAMVKAYTIRNSENILSFEDIVESKQ